MAAFGYLPKTNRIKDLLSRTIGYPHLIRRIQARSILRLAGNFHGKTIFDAGCGDGLFCIEYVRRGAARVIGIDLNENQINNGRFNINKLELDNVTLLVGNAERVPIKASSCDLVISNCALEHMEDDDRVLDEISRCLKPGGHLILSVPYDKRVKVLSVVDIMIKMPASVRRMLAPHYIEGTSTYEEAIWKLKRERFQEIRNYSLDDIKTKLAKCGLELVEYENNIKFFGAMCWELIAGLRIFHFTRALDLAFPVMYPISLLDELLPVHWRGEEMAVKARKRRSDNGNDQKS